jgi:RimJ/RimL family protein N-acetyltransferase
MRFQIEGERLYVRPPREDDAPAMRVMTQDPEMMRFLNAGEPMPDEWIHAARERQLVNVRDYGYCMGVLVQRSDDAVIGIGGLQVMKGSGETETGWWVRRADWGKGYASEVGLASLRYGFEVVGLDRIVAVADPDNAASIAVMRKIGMCDEGLRNAHALEPRYPDSDVAYYGIDRSDWAVTQPEANRT